MDFPAVSKNPKQKAISETPPVGSTARKQMRGTWMREKEETWSCLMDCVLKAPPLASGTMPMMSWV